MPRKKTLHWQGPRRGRLDATKLNLTLGFQGRGQGGTARRCDPVQMNLG